MICNTWFWGGDDPSIKGPGAWSWFHILWICITAVSCFFVIYFIARKRKYIYDLFVARISCSILLILEITKIITFITHYGYFRTEYLSLSICTLPLFALFVASCINNKKSKIQDYLFRFVAIFGLMGGTGVLLFPSTTLDTPFVYYSLHTMLWHSILIIVGLYYFVSLSWKKINIKAMVFNASVFTVFAMISLIINEVGYNLYILPTKDTHNDILNYFFISSHYPTSYPILTSIKPHVHFAVFVIIFLLFIYILITAIYFGRLLITKIIDNWKDK